VPNAPAKKQLEVNEPEPSFSLPRLHQEGMPMPFVPLSPPALFALHSGGTPPAIGAAFSDSQRGESRPRRDYLLAASRVLKRRWLS